MWQCFSIIGLIAGERLGRRSGRLWPVLPLSGEGFSKTAQIFALPGIGAYAVAGAQQQDVPVVQGTTVFFTLLIIIINLVTDLAYTALDPRVRTA